jgi:hypothetical protein
MLTGKVNRPQFVVGFLFIAVMLVVRGIPAITDWLDWLGLLIMLLLAAAIDEVGHEATGKQTGSHAAWFFRYRFTLRISALLLCILWPEFFPSAVGIWMFDFGYELAGRLAKTR